MFNVESERGFVPEDERDGVVFDIDGASHFKKIWHRLRPDICVWAGNWTGRWIPGGRRRVPPLRGLGFIHAQHGRAPCSGQPLESRRAQGKSSGVAFGDSARCWSWTPALITYSSRRALFARQEGTYRAIFCRRLRRLGRRTSTVHAVKPGLKPESIAR